MQSRKFNKFNNIGNPVTSVKRLSQWASDELIFLDITKDNNYDLKRDDQGYENRSDFLSIVKDVSAATFMPMTVGGGVKNLTDFEDRLSVGADKVSINTAAFNTPHLVNSAVQRFGSQCVVVSIDYREADKSNRVFVDGGATDTHINVVEYSKRIQDLGAGEILLNSIDRDGVGTGMDLNVIRQVADAVSIPVIACGGVGEWSHFAQVIQKTKADAVAAANIFHHTDQSVYYAKKELVELGCNVRHPDLIKIIQ